MPERISPTRLRGRRLAALLAAATAVVGATLIAAPAAMAAPATYGAITLTVDDTTITAGDTLTVTIAADTVADLYAYDLVVGYDPALLSFDAASAVYPTGGFGDAQTGTDAVTFSSTRLGTSPGLTGPQTLVSFTFTALAAGSADISLDSSTLIGTAGETTAVDVTAPGLTATTVIAAAPVTPGPSTSPTTTPSPSASALPITGTTPSDPLASTGADATPWLVTGAIGAALVALGAVLVIRRRQAATR
ncbi:cohesin domain-containing protein [Microbacterium sp. cx-59]|uniref:cohesin domain-containing protein n=1 Tax=Microbacterium sp. cx-59 TaxID=2891207 RepID=UPI002257C7AA|nr:cohesin domain-containing protein [Microbacterium sp. cx-59]